VKKLKEKRIHIAALLILGFTMMFSIATVNADSTVVSVINPLDGTTEFILPANTPANTTFMANITITDVEGLGGWQLNLTWDPALLKIADASHIFRNEGDIFGLTGIEVGRLIEDGMVYWGCSRGVGQSAFDGSGTLCQIRFTTVKNGTGEPTLCDLTFDQASPFPTEIYDILGLTLTYTPQDGSYIIPEFPTTILIALLLTATLLAFFLQKKNWLNHRRAIAE
jgi:hypothetical protein